MEPTAPCWHCASPGTIYLGNVPACALHPPPGIAEHRCCVHVAELRAELEALRGAS